MQYIKLFVSLFCLLYFACSVYAVDTLAKIKSKQASDSEKMNSFPPFNYIVGTQTIGAQYKFTEQPVLVETANEIMNMGSNIIKFNLVADKDVSVNNITSITQLVHKNSVYSKILKMPFYFYLFWVHAQEDKINFRDGMSAEEKTAVYDQFYDFSVFLLKEFNNTGKSFYLGHWEGDWLLVGSPFKAERDADSIAVKGMIDWLNIRAKAVDDAKKEVPHNNVYLYTYTEVNMVQKAMKNGITLTNNILPHSNVDYVSYSCYDSLYPFHDSALSMDQRKDKIEKLLLEAMNYIESKLKGKKDVPGKRVFIGEYGFALEQVKEPEIQDEFARTVIKSALEWGCPFVLYWEMYCNTINHPSSDYLGYGFWMIDNKGIKQPVYYTHKNILSEGKKIVNNYRIKNSNNPIGAQYNQFVLKFLKEISN